MTEDKEADIRKYEDQIRELLRMEIATRYYFQKGKVEASLENDPELSMAREIMVDPEKYNAILSGVYNQPEPVISEPAEEENREESNPENE